MINSIYNNPYLYGSGLINTPAPIGYGVTNSPLFLPTFWSLGDRYWTSNLGFETQHNIYDGGYDPLVYYLAHNKHLMYSNSMLLGLTDGLGGTAMTSGLSQEGIERARQAGEDAWKKISSESFAKRAGSTLANLAALLNQVKADENLTDEQKEKVQEKIDKVKDLQNRIQEALKNNADLDTLDALDKELKELGEEINTLAKEIAQAIEDKKAKESNDGDDTSSSSNSSSGSGSSGGKTDEATGRPASLGEAPKESELENYCAKVYGALVVAGTDHNVLDPAMEELNAGNIVEVIKHWEDNYGKHTATGNDGFFAKILDDIGDGDQKKLVPFMRDALIERAEALGIYDEIKQYVSEVNKELNKGTSWKKLWCGTWMDDHKIANALMNIYNKIVAKEQGNKTETETKANTDKAEADKKKAEKETKAKDLFLGDMRDIWEDNELEISDKVKYEDGKWTIRIKGEDYTAASFKALVKVIEDAGYDAKQYLAKPKQVLDTVC